MPRFRLHYLHHDLEFPVGEFVVGRSGDCELALDDPLVSRRHATFHVTRERLALEDLGSRNGVKVNGARVATSTALGHGDVVTIGGQDLRISVVPDAPDVAPQRPTVTMTQEQTRKPSNALALLAGVVDKAFAMGRVDEAERILSNVLSDTLAGLQRGTRDTATLPEATRYALRLAAETSKTTWIDWVFHAHNAAAKVLPVTTVDELYVLVRRVRYPVTPALKSYVATLRTQADRLSATERFALQRIEGLVRVLLA